MPIELSYMFKFRYMHSMFIWLYLVQTKWKCCMRTVYNFMPHMCVRPTCCVLIMWSWILPFRQHLRAMFNQLSNMFRHWMFSLREWIFLNFCSNMQSKLSTSMFNMFCHKPSQMYQLYRRILLQRCFQCLQPNPVMFRWMFSLSIGIQSESRTMYSLHDESMSNM